MLIRSDTDIFIPRTYFAIGIKPKYDFMNQFSLDQRKKTYQEALDTIQKYMKDYGMDRPEG